ncbi:cupin domain-containing protein [Pusillimonas soli]|uniref:Cupin domain-containing protein n=2 Tax=Allopusillimonas soli TaxID=659016 RepID=A0A853F6I7_9BURK|nr:cupin domain-containing protein [Allopusillimonas soli]NYT35579.1 cupin domain-containing protein [Allopusillimonas soli]
MMTKEHDTYQPTAGASRYIDTTKVDWQPYPKIPGVFYKVLYENKELGALTCLQKFPAGLRIPPHEHPELQQTFVLEGCMQDHDGVANAGGYIVREPGSKHENYCPVETIALVLYGAENKVY